MTKIEEVTKFGVLLCSEFLQLAGELLLVNSELLQLFTGSLTFLASISDTKRNMLETGWRRCWRFFWFGSLSIDKQIDGWMDGWMDGWISDVFTCFCMCFTLQHMGVIWGILGESCSFATNHSWHTGENLSFFIPSRIASMLSLTGWNSAWHWPLLNSTERSWQYMWTNINTHQHTSHMTYRTRIRNLSLF